MQKWMIVCVFFVFISALAAGCAPATFTNPVQVNATVNDSITSLGIAIDGDGVKHIVGLKDNKIVYFKGNIGQPSLQFTMDWGLLPPGTDTSTWKQYNPEVAVLSDGTAYIVWFETRGVLTEKVACYYKIPADAIPAKLHNCNRLDAGNITTGEVHVIAQDDTAYAVYSRSHSTGYVDSVWYKKFKDLTTTGLVVSYLDVLESAEIFSMDLTMDQYDKLHIAYIDKVSPSPDARLWYRSDASTNMDNSMSQVWAIEPGASGVVASVMPSITIHQSGSDSFVYIANVWYLTGFSELWIHTCNLVNCSNKNAAPLTHGLSDWNSSTDFLELKGLSVFNTYNLSFIAHNDLSDDYQVWFWNAPTSGEPTQVTNSSYTKSNLHLVDGGFPVLGYLESWVTTDFSTRYHEKVSIYDETQGVREVLYRVSSSNYKGKTADMASYVGLAADSIPVAGVWNICGSAWFSTNAYLIDLPIILK